MGGLVGFKKLVGLLNLVGLLSLVGMLHLEYMVADSNIVKVVVSFKGCSELHLTSVKKRFCHLN